MLVHFARMPRQAGYKKLEAEWGTAKVAHTLESRALCLGREIDDMRHESITASASRGAMALLYDIFAAMDENGDGVLDRDEFCKILQSVDANFFSERNVLRMLDNADANDDGVVQYGEFVAWLTNVDSGLRGRVHKVASRESSMARGVR